MTKGQLKLLQKECWEEKIISSMTGKGEDMIDKMSPGDTDSSSEDSSGGSESDSETTTPKKSAKKKQQVKKGQEG